ncbi:MAG: VCBS repeat-containing protein [Anaerolineae bacterium]|nr:VCBS repeat-containing protein [Anaerolineae bacterium]
MKHTHRFLIIAILLSLLLTNHRVNTQPLSASIQTNPITVLLGSARVRESSPVAADFNGDGYKELVVGTVEGKLHVVSYNGSEWVSVWSRQTNDDINSASPPNPTEEGRIRSSAAIADLDNDGHLDIVVTVGGDAHQTDDAERRNGGVLVYRYNSAWDFSLLAPASVGCVTGWPQPCIDQIGKGTGFSNPDGYWDGIVTTPALGDIDGDNDLEIIVEGIDRRIHAWHHDGTTVEGWPISQWEGDDLWRGGISSPALGDLDDDGLPEIVFGTMSAKDLGDMGKEGTLWAVNGDSSLLPGFPIETEQYIYSSPALGDIDGDDKLEIVVGVGTGIAKARMNIVYAWNHDGTPVQQPGGLAWPQETQDTNDATTASPSLGDIDGDGELEIVIGGTYPYGVYENNLYAWNVDGSLVPGFPMKPRSPNLGLSSSFPMPVTPILADIDGDGTVEILVTHMGSPGVAIVEPNGTTSDYTTYSFSGMLDTEPLVDDIDNDGLLELIAAGEDHSVGQFGALEIWDLPGATASARPWPMARRDVMRTGLLPLGPSPELGFPTNLNLSWFIGDNAQVTHSFDIWNENDEGEFDWQLTTSNSLLQLTPTAGTALSDRTSINLTVDTAGVPSGTSVLGAITATATYDGKAIKGSPKSATVSIYIEPQPELDIPDVINLLHQEGSGNTTAGSFHIRNAGGGYFDWQLTPLTSDIQLSPASGTLTDHTTVNITADLSDQVITGWLPIGSFNITATVDSTPIQGSPKTVFVNVFIGDLKYVYLPLIIR